MYACWIVWSKEGTKSGDYLLLTMMASTTRIKIMLAQAASPLIRIFIRMFVPLY